MVVNEAIKYHCSAPDNLCFTVKYSYQNANNYFANSSMLLLIEYCSNWCKLTMADYLVAHCLVYSTGVFQYQSVLVLAPVRCRAREILLFPHFPHSWWTLSHLHHGANLEATIFKSWWFLGHFDQNELYHTPLQSKTWDLGDRDFFGGGFL